MHQGIKLTLLQNMNIITLVTGFKFYIHKANMSAYLADTSDYSAVNIGKQRQATLPGHDNTAGFSVLH